MKVKDFIHGGRFEKWGDIMLFPVRVFPEYIDLPFQDVPLNTYHNLDDWKKWYEVIYSS